MDKSNLELFKQAVNEGLSNKFDSIVQGCTEEITYSDRHKIAMQTLVYGKTNNRRTLSPKMRRIIAILVAAALLLTSCGIIFRNEIREFFREFYVKLNYSDSNAIDTEIEEIYQLTYVPEGYFLIDEIYNITITHYVYADNDGNKLYFDQRLLNSSIFIIDSESGYSKIDNIEGYEIYYRRTKENYIYVYNDRKYSMQIKSNMSLSNQELISILDGITIK